LIVNMKHLFFYYLFKMNSKAYISNNKLLLGFGVSVGTFGIGYLIWRFYKFLANREITEESVDISNKKLIDVSEVHIKQDEGFDDSSSDVSKEINKAKNPEGLIDMEKMNKIYKRITDISVLLIMKACKYIESLAEKTDPKTITGIINFLK
jgi:hypothetical protein